MVNINSSRKVSRPTTATATTARTARTPRQSGRVQRLKSRADKRKKEQAAKKSEQLQRIKQKENKEIKEIAEKIDEGKITDIKNIPEKYRDDIDVSQKDLDKIQEIKTKNQQIRVYNKYLKKAKANMKKHGFMPTTVPDKLKGTKYEEKIKRDAERINIHGGALEQLKREDEIEKLEKAGYERRIYRGEKGKANIVYELPQTKQQLEKKQEAVDLFKDVEGVKGEQTRKLLGLPEYEPTKIPKYTAPEGIDYDEPIQEKIMTDDDTFLDKSSDFVKGTGELILPGNINVEKDLIKDDMSISRIKKIPAKKIQQEQGATGPAGDVMINIANTWFGDKSFPYYSYKTFKEGFKEGYEGGYSSIPGPVIGSGYRFLGANTKLVLGALGITGKGLGDLSQDVYRGYDKGFTGERQITTGTPGEPFHVRFGEVVSDIPETTAESIGAMGRVGISAGGFVVDKTVKGVQELWDVTKDVGSEVSKDYMKGLRSEYYDGKISVEGQNVNIFRKALNIPEYEPKSEQKQEKTVPEYAGIATAKGLKVGGFVVDKTVKGGQELWDVTKDVGSEVSKDYMKGLRSEYYDGKISVEGQNVDIFRNVEGAKGERTREALNIPEYEPKSVQKQEKTVPEYAGIATAKGLKVGGDVLGITGEGLGDLSQDVYRGYDKGYTGEAQLRRGTFGERFGKRFGEVVSDIPETTAESIGAMGRVGVGVGGFVVDKTAKGGRFVVDKTIEGGQELWDVTKDVREQGLDISKNILGTSSYILGTSALGYFGEKGLFTDTSKNVKRVIGEPLKVIGGGGEDVTTEQALGNILKYGTSATEKQIVDTKKGFLKSDLGSQWVANIRSAELNREIREAEDKLYGSPKSKKIKAAESSIKDKLDALKDPTEKERNDIIVKGFIDYGITINEYNEYTKNRDALEKLKNKYTTPKEVFQERAKEGRYTSSEVLMGDVYYGLKPIAAPVVGGALTFTPAAPVGYGILGTYGASQIVSGSEKLFDPDKSLQTGISGGIQTGVGGLILTAPILKAAGIGSKTVTSKGVQFLARPVAARKALTTGALSGTLSGGIVGYQTYKDTDDIQRALTAGGVSGLLVGGLYSGARYQKLIGYGKQYDLNKITVSKDYKNQAYQKALDRNLAFVGYKKQTIRRGLFSDKILKSKTYYDPYEFKVLRDPTIGGTHTIDVTSKEYIRLLKQPKFKLLEGGITPSLKDIRRLENIQKFGGSAGRIGLFKEIRTPIVRIPKNIKELTMGVDDIPKSVSGASVFKPKTDYVTTVSFDRTAAKLLFKGNVPSLNPNLYYKISTNKPNIYSTYSGKQGAREIIRKSGFLKNYYTPNFRYSVGNIQKGTEKSAQIFSGRNVVTTDSKITSYTPSKLGEMYKGGRYTVESYVGKPTKMSMYDIDDYFRKDFLPMGEKYTFTGQSKITEPFKLVKNQAMFIDPTSTTTRRYFEFGKAYGMMGQPQKLKDIITIKDGQLLYAPYTGGPKVSRQQKKTILASRKAKTDQLDKTLSKSGYPKIDKSRLNKIILINKQAAKPSRYAGTGTYEQTTGGKLKPLFEKKGSVIGSTQTIGQRYISQPMTRQLKRVKDIIPSSTSRVTTNILQTLGLTSAAQIGIAIKPEQTQKQQSRLDTDFSQDIKEKVITKTKQDQGQEQEEELISKTQTGGIGSLPSPTPTPTPPEPTPTPPLPTPTPTRKTPRDRFKKLPVPLLPWWFTKGGKKKKDKDKKTKLIALTPDFTARALSIAPEKLTKEQATHKAKKVKTGADIRTGVKLVDNIVGDITQM